MTVNIRLASLADSAAIAAIYAPIVAETTISFEYEPPSAAAMGERITSTLTQYPWLVCTIDDVVAGYAYAGLHRKRTAYQWSTEVSAYVSADYRQRGVGKALYTSLFALLAVQGYINAYAGITMPNPPSVRLHRSVGFKHVGVYHNVGFKFGAWHDTTWWERPLQEHSLEPSPPQPITAITGTPAADEALHAGVGLVRG